MKKKILVCDDDEGILDVISLLFVNKGYDVVTEAHSINVYKAIEEAKPDLVVLDLWMPLLNGEDIAKKLKSDPATSKLPLLLMSATRDRKRIAEKTAADAFVSKPFKIKDLLVSIEKLLS